MAGGENGILQGGAATFWTPSVTVSPLERFWRVLRGLWTVPVMLRTVWICLAGRTG
ncbi:MAG: hypothetical protein WBD14_11635 [Phycisphaerae bacterium]